METIEYHVTDCYAAGVYMTRFDAEQAAAERWPDGRPGEGTVAEVDVTDYDYDDDDAAHDGVDYGEW